MKMLIALIAFALTTNAALALLGGGAPHAQATAGLVLAQQDTRPMERTTTTSPMTPRTTPPKHILFSCTDKSCGCKGQDDCFDLGTKGICGPTSGWNCTGNDCTCAKKAQ